MYVNSISTTGKYSRAAYKFLGEKNSCALFINDLNVISKNDKVNVGPSIRY